MDTSLPFWIKQLSPNLQHLEQIPLWNGNFKFPLDKVVDWLKNEFDLKHLSIQISEAKFISSPFQGLAKDLNILPISVIPLESSCFWLCALNDLGSLNRLFLSPQPTIKGLSDPKLQEGFYYFLCSSFLAGLKELNIFKQLSLNIGSDSLKESEGVAYDITLSVDQISVYTRLFFPKSFHEEWQQKVENVLELKNHSSLGKKIILDIHLKIGTTVLSPSDWASVKKGDFILLDKCSFDPNTRKGYVDLSLPSHRLFRGEYKDSQIKIKDYIFYEQDNLSMDKQDIFEEDLPDDSNHHSQNDEENHELESSALSFEEEEEEVQQEDLDPFPVSEDLKPNEIDLTFHLEICRLQLSLEKLLQIKEGQLIPLSYKAEDKVNLVLNGKVVARGEVVKIGDHIAFKVSEMG
ncbi:MAG: type III secretion system cytoplasmic ring protein SctQ [Rhabdochlamydiaceae bacterium]